MSAPTRRTRIPIPASIALVLVYVGTAALAIWQAAMHPSPTIFTDELEMTQLARSIADTGHATLRGLPYGHLTPLAAYLSAPFWLIDDVPTAYSWIKVSNALLMASAVFPAYALARLAVSRRWALFAAAGTGLSPALAYAPILVKEPTAYPAATLALFLVARYVARPTGWSFVLAAGGCGLGFLAKSQLVVLFGVLLLAAGAVVWRTERMTAFRRTWTRSDWVGAVVLMIGVVIAGNALISHTSTQWYISTAFFQDRMVDYSLWAGGALAIGLGIVPLIAGLASLVRPKGEAPRPGVDALAIVTVSSIACFGIYTAVKAAFLSTVFATLTVERNLIFLVPLLFAGTALFLERRGGRWWAVVAAGAFGIYLVHTTPYSLTQFPNYEAHGLAIIAFANRIFRWPAGTIEQALIAVTLVATVTLALVPRLRPARVATGVVAVLAGMTLLWTGTTEVYAAHGESDFSRRLYATLPKPANWLDLQTKGRPTLFLGQAVRDANPVNLLEFWNRSLVKIWALDGTAPGPGATATPNVDKPDGTLTNPFTNFVLTTPGVDISGRRVGTPVGGYSLFAVEGPPRLRTAVTGVYPDGWMGPSATYSQYEVPSGEAGHVVVVLSQTWCGKPVRSVAVIRVGPIAITGGQPTIARVTGETTAVIHSCQVKTFVLPTPPVSWRTEVTIAPTFSPAEVDPRQSDPRQLGAVVTFRYVPGR